MRIVYISHGDVPSKWSHSFQAMKMADALAGLVVSLELLTSGSLWRGAERRVPLRSWYGVRPRLRVVRLPVFWRRRDPFFASQPGARFENAALRYVQALRPQLVYTRSKRAALGCLRSGLATLLEAHESPKQSETERRAFEALAQRAADPALLGVVTLSDALAELYREAGIPDPKLGVWTHGVDLLPFERAPVRREARLRMGLPEHATLAVYCGHFDEASGVSCLVEAVRQTPEIGLCLVGGTPRDTARMRQQAAGLRNVHFESFVPQRLVPGSLAAADVLVLPQPLDADADLARAPLKLFESMAARRPLVATRVPAVEGLLRDGENALLVEPDSPDAMAAALRRLAADPELGQRLADRARADVAVRSWERRAREILERFLHPA